MTKDPIDMVLPLYFAQLHNGPTKNRLEVRADSQIWSSVQLFKESPIKKKNTISAWF